MQHWSIASGKRGVQGQRARLLLIVYLLGTVWCAARATAVSHSVPAMRRLTAVAMRAGWTRRRAFPQRRKMTCIKRTKCACCSLAQRTNITSINRRRVIWRALTMSSVVAPARRGGACGERQARAVAYGDVARPRPAVITQEAGINLHPSNARPLIRDLRASRIAGCCRLLSTAQPAWPYGPGCMHVGAAQAPAGGGGGGPIATPAPTYHTHRAQWASVPHEGAMLPCSAWSCLEPRKKNGTGPRHSAPAAINVGKHHQRVAPNSKEKECMKPDGFAARRGASTKGRVHECIRAAASTPRSSPPTPLAARAHTHTLALLRGEPVHSRAIAPPSGAAHPVLHARGCAPARPWRSLCMCHLPARPSATSPPAASTAACTLDPWPRPPRSPPPPHS